MSPLFKPTRRALNDLESALSALELDVLPLNPARFALMAEPGLDWIADEADQVGE